MSKTETGSEVQVLITTALRAAVNSAAGLYGSVSSCWIPFYMDQHHLVASDKMHAKTEKFRHAIKNRRMKEKLRFCAWWLLVQSRLEFLALIAKNKPGSCLGTPFCIFSKAAFHRWHVLLPRFDVIAWFQLLLHLKANEFLHAIKVMNYNIFYDGIFCLAIQLINSEVPNHHIRYGNNFCNRAKITMMV